MFLVGNYKTPIYICKRKEVRELFSKTFWFIYYLWEDYKYGFLDRSNVDPEVKKCIIDMQKHYDRNFTNTANIRRYIEMYFGGK